MICNKCEAEFKPPKGLSVSKCPFCGEPVILNSNADNGAPAHEVLLNIVQQFGKDTIGQSTLKGLIADLMPYAEKSHLRIFRQAVDDSIGTKLLDMQSDTRAVRTLKITALKENFRNNNAFNHTADYVVDCFLFALGWFEGTPLEKANQVSVDSLNILNQQAELAFSDGKLTKDEARLLYQFAESLHIPETTVSELLVKKIKTSNFFPTTTVDKSLKNHKTIICTTDWQQNQYESVEIGDQVWMKRNLNVSHFRNGDPIPEAKSNKEWEKAGKEGKPAWCFYDNNPENGKIYGKLYNWYAVYDPRGLAPEGWHVPSDEEWTHLINMLYYLDIDNNPETLRNEYFQGRNSETCKSILKNFGFSMLLGGFRDKQGGFKELGENEYFWCCDEKSEIYAWGRAWQRIIHWKEYSEKVTGYYVRCLINNTYSHDSIKIGNQIWMKRNLDVSHFRNGDPIPEAKTDAEWIKAGEEGKSAWCYYDNDPENGKIYGKLYNWYAVNDSRGLAPEGWKIPTDFDWKTLREILGGKEIAGERLKYGDFSALNAGGRHNYDPDFNGVGSSIHFWCSDEISFDQALNYISYNKALSWSVTPKCHGFSVRCVWI